MLNLDDEAKELKNEIKNSFDIMLNDLISLCKSPIEEIFFLKLLNEFTSMNFAPYGLGFFRPVYDVDEVFGQIKIVCCGVSISDSYTRNKISFKNDGEIEIVGKAKIEIEIFPQIKVEVSSKNYFLDFGLYVKDLHNPNLKTLKIAIECDGFDFHSSKEQINNDNIRTRNLVSNGWHVIRYSGNEINSTNKIDFFNEIKKIENLIHIHFNIPREEDFK